LQQALYLFSKVTQSLRVAARSIQPQGLTEDSRKRSITQQARPAKLTDLIHPYVHCRTPVIFKQQLLKGLTTLVIQNGVVQQPRL
jgi:hypothetical protein